MLTGLLVKGVGKLVLRDLLLPDRKGHGGAEVVHPGGGGGPFHPLSHQEVGKLLRVLRLPVGLIGPLHHLLDVIECAPLLVIGGDPIQQGGGQLRTRGVPLHIITRKIRLLGKLPEQLRPVGQAVEPVPPEVHPDLRLCSVGEGEGLLGLDLLHRQKIRRAGIRQLRAVLGGKRFSFRIRAEIHGQLSAQRDQGLEALSGEDLLHRLGDCHTGVLVPKHALTLPIPGVQNQGGGGPIGIPLDLRHPAPEVGFILNAAAGAQGKQKERGQQKAPFLHVVHSPIRG